MRYTHILWDWNGTLLDDLEVSVASVCGLLAELGLPPTTAQSYRAQIEIPAERYYSKLVDLKKYPLELLAERYMEGYRRHITEAGLREGADEALRAFAGAGLRQAVISSFEQQALLKLAEGFGIAGYFDFISGAQDCFSQSKIERARLLLEQQGVNPAHAVVIGDMAHDAQMAAALKAGCILCSGGHQCPEKLHACGVKVVSNLHEAVRWVLSHA